LLLMVGLQYLVQRTKTGQQMRAVAFNQRTASLLGINVSQVYILTFFIAGLLGGAAGMLFGLAYQQVTPFIGDTVSLIGLTAIVLGGLGSIQGAVLGGFIVAAIQTFSTAAGGSSYRDAIVFSLLFLVLLLRPQGLLGQPEQNRA
jgi:branched-chain amino acid transport system permease protein